MAYHRVPLSERQAPNEANAPELQPAQIWGRILKQFEMKPANERIILSNFW